MSTIRMLCRRKLTARRSYVPSLSECEPQMNRTDGFVALSLALSSVTNKASSAPTCWRDPRRVGTWKLPRTKRTRRGRQNDRRHLVHRSALQKGPRRTPRGRSEAYIQFSLSSRCPACFAGFVMVLFCFCFGSGRASVECFRDWLKGRALV